MNMIAAGPDPHIAVVTDLASQPATDQVADAKAEIPAAPDDGGNDMPLPRDPMTVFVGGLFFIAVIAVLSVAADIIMPVVLAIVLKLLLQPLVRAMESVRVPRGLAAVVAVGLLLCLLVGIVMALRGPAASWAGKLPEALPKLRQQMPILDQPIQALDELFQQVRTFAGGGEAGATGTMALRPATVLTTLFSSARTLLSVLFTTLLVLVYLLIFGETFLRRTVEILPRFNEKRRAVEISLQIERDLSVYMITITAINIVVGIATGVVMWLCGVGDPVLWAVAATLLNFIPILGPIAGIGLFIMVGVLALGATWWAVLPAGLYFAIHVLEGEIVTPMLLAHRFTINPVAVVLGLVFWFWLWGVPGAILAVPMLAIVKIVCDSLRPFRAFGHFLEG